MANPSGPVTNLDALNVAGVPTMGAGGYPYPLPLSPQTLFVSSVVGSNGNTGGMGDPFASVAYVMANKAVARNASNPAGTVIVVLPGHSETISSSTALACSVAGVTVLGLGLGNQRPLFTLNTANTATIAVSADGVSWINCRFVANFLSIAACFTLSTAKFFRLISCEFRDTDSTHDFLNIVKSTGSANTVDGLTANDNVWVGTATASVNAFILSANDIDSLTVLRNKWYSPNTTDQAWIVITAGSITMVDVGYNQGYRKSTTSVNGTLINCTGTSCIGWVHDNYSRTLGSGDLFVPASTGLSFFNNMATDAADTSGFLRPAADT